MKGIITLTQILMPVLIGCLIGSLIAGNSESTTTFLLLLVADIAIGIALQVAYEAKENTYNKNSNDDEDELKKLLLLAELAKILKEEEKEPSANLLSQGSYFDDDEEDLDQIDDDEEYEDYEDEEEDDGDEEYEEDDGDEEYEDYDEEDFTGIFDGLNFNDVNDDREEEQLSELSEEQESYSEFSIEDKLWILNKFFSVYSKLNNNESGGDLEAVDLICGMCARMLHAPTSRTLNQIKEVSICNIHNFPAILYSFNYNPSEIAQTINLFLVKGDDTIRMFTVETSFPYALCEYSNGKHLLHGQIELEEADSEIFKRLI